MILKVNNLFFMKKIETMNQIDLQRNSKGFLTIDEIMNKISIKNIVLDPHSLLIGKEVVIGSGNVFYPNTVVEIQNTGKIIIGNQNVFFPQTLLLAGPGKIIIGDSNQFGDGGVSIKANYPDSLITIGNNGRYLNGVQIVGKCQIGSGSQIIGGQITVQDCVLESGETFSFSDPDQRGAVLKGFGLARGIILNKGQVLNGSGIFDQSEVKNQSYYHPKK
jgi:carbonic anhydrase/acetyltransferase-like protein (isoleucine patch superfamily)